MSKATIVLNTGTMMNPLAGINQNTANTDTNSSERIIYPKPTEQYISVAPGHMTVITAYTTSCSCVQVNKILLSNGTPDTVDGSGCCFTITKGAETTVLNRVAIPAYALNKDNPITILNIPGVYSVTPTDDNDGSLVITAMDYLLQQNGPVISDVNCDCTGE